MINYEKMATDIVDQMSMEEIMEQLLHQAPQNQRLGIPEYNWWGEALHGVARAGTASVFPQAIALAATFDVHLIEEIADVIATEARAKFNASVADDDRDIYKGLTLWAPNLNIFRDPRWGRGHETYGEDPYLTARMGVAFIRGLQGVENYENGEEPKRLKTAACAKHFAVHSGPEAQRHSFNAVVNEKDLEETYLPAFHEAVTEGKVAGVMGAYNRINGVPACANRDFNWKLLREKWGFSGYYVSDCWAVKDIYENHKVVDTPAKAAAMAINSGCDLNCGKTYAYLKEALEEGLVKEESIKQALKRLLIIRMKLGILSDMQSDYDKISFLENDTPEHQKLVCRAAEKSIVLLKNNGILPLKKVKYSKIGIIGPTADSRNVLEGNYFGRSSVYITNLDGIRQYLSTSDTRIIYSEGCHLYKKSFSCMSKESDRLSEAKAVVNASDVILLFLGLDATIEGEEGDAGNMYGAGDKDSLMLPDCQQLLQKTVIELAKAKGKEVIAVINAGSAVDISYLKEHCSAILYCWYSGAYGGAALANVLFGDVNPSARLPITLYKEGQLPDFLDYSMKNRTYRYLREEPLYTFGFGLSYTSFLYHFIKAEPKPMTEKGICVKIKVENSGSFDGEEAVLVYIDKCPKEKDKYLENANYIPYLSAENQPIRSLCAFNKIYLRAGEVQEITLHIRETELMTVLENGERILLKGRYTLEVAHLKESFVYEVS